MNKISQADLIKEVLDSAINAHMKSLFFCRPAVVASFDPVKQEAQILVAIKEDGESLSLINGVKVQFPSFNGCGLYHKIEQGCQGLAFFADRDCDKYLNQGGEQEPETERRHSIDDAFFVPGIRPDTNPISDFVNDGVTLFNSSSLIRVQDNGDILAKCGTLNVQGNAVISGDQTTQGNVTISGTTSQQGAVTMASNLSVGGTINVTGAANFGATITAAGIVSGAEWTGGGVVLSGGSGSADDFSVGGVSLADHVHDSGTLKAPNGSVNGQTGGMA